MVGARRFELPTSASRTLRANQTALRPVDQYIISGNWDFEQPEIGEIGDKGKIAKFQSLNSKQFSWRRGATRER